MVTTADQKRKAIKLAYRIVTDHRNADRYALTALTNRATGERFGYNEMVGTLEAMFDELNENEGNSNA